MRIRELARHEVPQLWTIDRAEVIEAMVIRRGDALVRRPERHDVKGWPEGEPERYGPLLLDCWDRGGSFHGAFDGDALVGAAVLVSRFLGRRRDRLQLKFLHVGRAHRGAGLGGRLFGMAVDRARARGARGIYVSATPSENTVRFYLRRGFRPTDEPDPELLRLEPEDLHLELALPAQEGGAPWPP